MIVRQPKPATKRRADQSCFLRQAVRTVESGAINRPVRSGGDSANTGQVVEAARAFLSLTALSADQGAWAPITSDYAVMLLIVYQRAHGIRQKPQPAGLHGSLACWTC